MNKIAEIKTPEFNLGDLITVDKYLLGNDRSYIGDVLKVLAIDGAFIHVRNLSFMGLTTVLDTRAYILRHLSPEFVSSVLNEKGKQS